MTHGCIKGFWKSYFDGMAALLEERGSKFTTFDEMMEQEGADHPWEDYDYSPEEYYYNVVYGMEIIDDTTKDPETQFAALRYSAEFAFAGSKYTLSFDEASHKVTVLDGKNVLAELTARDEYSIDGTVPEYIYRAVTVYPEIIDFDSVRDNKATIRGECLDSVTQLFMVLAGRAAELMDGCAEDY